MDVVWLGDDIRIFITSRLEDLTLLVVTVPKGTELGGSVQPVCSALADRRHTSYILPLPSGESFEIAGVSVWLEDCHAPDLGATPLRDRLLHVDAPTRMRVMRDPVVHHGISPVLYEHWFA